MTQTDPIQAQLIAARRNQILNAATKVFAEKGFHRATIRDVATAAGIADGTIYNYFDNKTALLLGILDRLNATSQRAADFEQAAHMDLQQWMGGYLKQRFGTLEPEAYQVFVVLLSEVLVNKDLGALYLSQIIQPTFEMAEKYFEQWIANGTIKALDSALSLRVIAGTAIGLLLLRLMGDVELQSRWAELPDVIAEIVLNGITKREQHE